MPKSTALSVTREVNFPDWFLEVVKEGDLADRAVTRGCMVIKPWGYSIWERIQAHLDGRFKATGHVNAYFPLLIPVSLIEGEADHVEGFAKEMAVVTHHRLVENPDHAAERSLIPDGRLEEPLVIRPTSETIIGESFRGWVQSWRDLPLLINQWANVVRWEMRPRLFLRTAEFLWQEGHTAHATAAEAQAETERMLEVYEVFAREFLAMPVVAGEKPPSERFPGAVNTYTIEAIMQDGKALQAGTSHFLGTHFAEASKIMFADRDGERKHAFTTSWGVSTRLIGGVIMTHSDDDGLRLPPQLAPHQVVFLPHGNSPEAIVACDRLTQALANTQWRGEPVRAYVDKRDLAAGPKRWSWIKKGVPLLITIGGRELTSGRIEVAKRWRNGERDSKVEIGIADIESEVAGLLDAAQSEMYLSAREFRDRFIVTDCESADDVVAAFSDRSGAVVIVPWDGDEAPFEELKELHVTPRCVPLTKRTQGSTCVFSGRPAVSEIMLARSY